MWHLSLESELRKSLLIALLAAQLETGVSWNILEQPGKIPHMSDTWISALCELMAPHDIQLKLCKLSKWHSYNLTCKQDSFIMDHFLKSKLYIDRELENLNRARIFHRALTISDLVNAIKGNRIQEQCYTLERNDQADHLM
jgi:hypothetical protein